jgi:hypothetical protein
VSGDGYLPDLATLYEQLRGGVVDLAHPLSRSEMLSMRFCRYCAQEMRNHGIEMFSVVATLQLMERIATSNVEHERKKYAERLYGPGGRPPRERSFINFVEPLANPFVNEVLEKTNFALRDEGRKKRSRRRKLAARHEEQQDVKIPAAKPHRKKGDKPSGSKKGGKSQKGGGKKRH